ncbi:MAG: hypothetical protein ACTSU7_02530 [Candidatus Heimdallarchaeaceae archaeon]
MLSRKLTLSLNGVDVGKTPMLVPSVSSRVNLPLSDLLKTISEIVYGPLLISSYDIYYSKDTLQVDFPELLFLDSGGYECNRDKDVSDIGLYNPNPLEWNKHLHSKVIDNWSIDIPTVVVSYDHPLERKSLEKQIKDANCLFHDKNYFLKEILIKPETRHSNRINFNSIIENVSLLSEFDIIGFTDKELGFSVLDRMTAIAKIRMAMDEEKITIPIHIFGSLDTVTTPLYFLAGADIFDGLSWLRFIYRAGDTLYIDSHGPKLYGANENMKKIWIRSIYRNYSYLRQQELNLCKFQSKGDFNLLGSDAEYFQKTYEDFIEKIGGI